METEGSWTIFIIMAHQAKQSKASRYCEGALCIIVISTADNGEYRDV
jgi:hypothetical protein